MAQFDLKQFYQELDRHYAAHDNAATEQFLCASREKARLAGAPLPFNDSCPSCVAPIEPNMDFICVCNEQACFYRGLSRFEACLEAFSAAQEELEQLYLTDTREYGVVLLNKAGAYRYMGDAEQAMALFQQARRILEAHSDTPAGTLAGLYNNIGLLSLDLHREEDAERCFHQALALLERTQDHQVELATTYNNIAALYSTRRQYQEAADAVRSSVEILSRLDDGLNAHYPAALNTRGALLYRLGDFEGALSDFALAAEKTEIIYGRNVEYAAACANCAAACRALARADEAAAWQAQSDACGRERRT
ncbi:MAG: tetratricopeptide repeat protein [Candidatus Ventricola sp.]